VTEAIAPLEDIAGVDAARFQAEIVAAARPVVLRGLVEAWPAVAAGREGAAAAAAYLARFDCGAPAEAFVGPPGIRGRFFWDDDISGFNFERRPGAFGSIVAAIAGIGDRQDAPAVYVGSAPVAQVLPGFDHDNRLGLLPPPLEDGRIWIGNESAVSAHFDESDNVACVVAGRRRFTLFPPEQVANLYVGPLDFTMAGQPASMVDLRAPDFAAHPRFRDALAAAATAELGPGDAIYIPALWWHGVEALDRFNILVNYWWRDAAPDAGAGMEVLAHGILGLAALPPAHRRAWRAMFDHYVFREGGDPAEHLPAERRGILGAASPDLRRKIRRFLQQMLGTRP
jgi:hypothetical protein